MSTDQHYCKSHGGYFVGPFQWITTKGKNGMAVTRRKICEACADKRSIADHEAAEAQKRENERARIQAEADAKAKAEADKVIEAERDAIKLAQEMHDNTLRMAEEDASHRAANDARELAVAVKELATPNIAPAPANIADNGARITLGQINTRLGLVAVTRDTLARMGFEPAGKDRAAILYRASDFPAICRAIAAHVLAVADQQHEQAAA